ncbi:MAG: dTMP kinase [Candidatus Aenigmatarchaeota archaeon]
MAGKFIVMEGLDGSGLSTQSRMLHEYLVSKKQDIILTKEQTDGIIGGLIKSSLRNEWNTDALALQMLFAADRSHHLTVEIEPALKEGKIVICDRYIFSTLAFGGLKADVEFLKTINSRFRKPDLTFIIDTEPETCLERIKASRFGQELFEDLEKSTQVRENYLALKDYFSNVHVIDGNRTKEKVFEDVKKIVDAVFKI